MAEIRVRIAPSPTGFLHVGTARTALFNYLFARKNGGKFVLRIEDTDLERSDPEYEKDVFAGLEWLKIEPDESPEKGGDYGPYRQSERLGFYRKHLEKLFAEGKVFYCFHSAGELAEEKERLMAAGKPPLHLCEYRTLDSKEAEFLKETNPNCIVRFKTPAGKKIIVNDLVRGEIIFASDLLGDFSVAKGPETPLYNFAVAVDDEEMKISHIIRGEDHISNTPKQLLLLEALGFKTPQYAHLPLILGPDRSKLSKRHGATSVSEYRKNGYLPEALFNFMALLGWNPGNNREIFSREELAEEFSLQKVQKAGAVFDIAKLEWMNGEYLRRKSPAEISELCLPYLKEAGLLKNKNLDYVRKVAVLEQPRLKKISEIGERADYFFKKPVYGKDLLRWKAASGEETAAVIDKSIEILLKIKKEKVNAAELKDLFMAEAEKYGDKGKLLWPLRSALSGKKASPGPFEIMEILGAEESLARLLEAKRKFGS